MKRTILLTGALVLTLASAGYAQNRTSNKIAGGPHDLSAGSALTNNNSTIDSQTCVFCHIPHSGSTDQPLWNRSAPSGSAYQPYTSSTSNVTATKTDVALSLSGACLSCHDGSIAMDVLTNVNGSAFASSVAFSPVSAGANKGAKATYGNTGGGANNLMNGGLPFLGSDLRNDHPVAIKYETARSADSTHYKGIDTDGGAKIYITGAAGTLPLYGSSTTTATVECSSCHDSHDNSKNGTNGGFLRQANTGSQMCKACHLK